MAKLSPIAGISDLLSLAPARRLVSRAARRLGYYVTKDPATILQAEHLRRIFTALGINCVLDVGAHQGDFAAWLRAIGYAGLILSFEPVAANYEILERRAGRDKHWHPHRIGLGATSGDAEMQIFSGNTFHSFLESSAFGRERFPNRMQVERREVVHVERLDAIIDALVPNVPDPHIFLKVDTQGFDMEVIRGLGARVDTVQAVQVEIAVKRLYEGSTNGLLDTWAELERLGFGASAMFPVGYDADGISLVEFDCVMCRPTDGPAAP